MTVYFWVCVSPPKYTRKRQRKKTITKGKEKAQRPWIWNRIQQLICVHVHNAFTSIAYETVNHTKCECVAPNERVIAVFIVVGSNNKSSSCGETETQLTKTFRKNFLDSLLLLPNTQFKFYFCRQIRLFWPYKCKNLVQLFIFNMRCKSTRQPEILHEHTNIPVRN